MGQLEKQGTGNGTAMGTGTGTGNRTGNRKREQETRNCVGSSPRLPNEYEYIRYVPGDEATKSLIPLSHWQYWSCWHCSRGDIPIDTRSFIGHNSVSSI